MPRLPVDCLKEWLLPGTSQSSPYQPGQKNFWAGINLAIFVNLDGLCHDAGHDDEQDDDG